MFPSLLRNLHSLGGMILPWKATVLPHEWIALCVHSCILGAWYYHFHHGSNFLLLLEGRYYRPVSGTSARAVLPRGPAVLPRHRGRVGLRAGQGSSNSPIPIHIFSPPRLSLSPAQEWHQRSSPDLSLRPLSSHSVRWDRSPPRPLPMDPSISPSPPPFVPFLCF